MAIKVSELKLLTITRVAYGSKDTPFEDREFKIRGRSPVGNISDWTHFAQKEGYAGLRVREHNEPVDFIIF